MAVTSMMSFEARNIHAEGVALTGTAAISQTYARTGTSSLRCNPASGASGYIATPAGSVYVHFGLYIAALPSGDRIICGNTGTSTANLRLTAAGKLTYYNNTTLVGTSNQTLSTGQWYWIGFRAGSAGSSVILVEIDGYAEIIGDCPSTAAAFLGCRGTEAVTGTDLYFDDYITDGAGFLKPSKVALLIPISDNGVTGWTNAAGGGTNLYQDTDNEPPVGVASPTTQPAQIKRAAANTTDVYSANMTTYATAGITASDTILAVQAMLEGAYSYAGSSSLGLQVTSNPAIGETTHTITSATVGAYPSGWTRGANTLTTLPSVTLSTSPVVRVRKNTSHSTRIQYCCFMGLHVAWTPYVKPPAAPGVDSATTSFA